jgi:hypothetical protein
MAAWCRLCLAWLTLAVPLAARAEFRLSVSPTALTQDDEAVLTVQLNGAYDEYQPPAGGCFALSAPSQSSQISVVNGRMSRSEVYRYRLTPTRAGACTVGPAKVSVDGQWVETNRVELNVKPGEQVAPVTADQARDLASKAGQPFFLQAVLPPRAVYRGEPFVLGFDLYVRADTAVRDANMGQPPELKGFLVEDLLGGKTGRGRQQAVGRATYTVYPVVRSLVVPLHEGVTEVGSVEGTVVAGDMFNARRYRVRSPVVRLDVKPLPAQGRPAGFDDASLGAFAVKAAVDKQKVRLGEGLVYSLTVSGSGNLEHLSAPPFPAVAGLDVAPLPSGSDDQVVKDRDGVHGARVFQYVLTPTREGRLVIPALAWPWFNPATGQYAVADTPVFTLEVAGGLPHGATGPETARDEPAPVRPPALAEALGDAATSGGGSGRVAPLAALGGLALLLLGLEARHRVRLHRRAHGAELTRSHALANAHKRLAARLKAAGPEQATAALHDEVVRFLEERLGVEPRRLSLAELQRDLGTRGVQPERAAAVVRLLEELEARRYVPAGGGQATEDARQLTLALLAEVDREA